MIDYELQFIALSEVGESEPVSKPNTWGIERDFFCQFVGVCAQSVVIAFTSRIRKVLRDLLLNNTWYANQSETNLLWR